MTAAILSAPDNQGFSGVVLGGSSYLARGAGFTGAADAKTVLGSFWIYLSADNFSNVIFSGSGLGFLIAFDAGNGVSFSAYNAGGSPILFTSSAPSRTLNRWHHVAYSFDMASAAAAQVYINGTAATYSFSTYTNDSIDFTRSDWSVAANSGGASAITGRLAEFYCAFGQYLDLSVGANLAKFISGGKPVALGSDGSLPTGTAPTLLLSTGPGFTVNRGTGGGMTLTGSLTSTSPIALP
jgi:hypothetical protein